MSKVLCSSCTANEATHVANGRDLCCKCFVAFTGSRVPSCAMCACLLDNNQFALLSKAVHIEHTLVNAAVQILCNESAPDGARADALDYLKKLWNT